MLTKVFRLFGTEVVNRDLAFYILNGVVGKQAQKNLTETRMKLIAEVANQTDDLLDCLNIPKDSLYAPIAGDYVKYNAYPNYGEVIGAKLWMQITFPIWFKFSNILTWIKDYLSDL